MFGLSLKIMESLLSQVSIISNSLKPTMNYWNIHQESLYILLVSKFYSYIYISHSVIVVSFQQGFIQLIFREINMYDIWIQLDSE